MQLRFLLLLLLFVTAGGEASEPLAPVTVIEPQDKTLYVGELATIVIEAPAKKVDTLIIVLDNNKSYKLLVNAEKETYCKTVKIRPGENILTVSSYLKGSKVQESDLQLFYLPELYEGIDMEPEGYEKYYFHTNKNEELCVSCHNMTSNIPTGDKVFEDVTETTCYECHKTMISKKNSHAPAINWRCTDCHDGTVGEYDMGSDNLSKYQVADPVNKTCESCHESAEAWDHNRYVHGPVNDGRCERCHNPHGSDNEFFLRKPIWDLCTTCHAGKAEGKHVVSSFVYGRNQGAHPTKGRKDPSRPGRELVCSSCHNPHGSSGVNLLRMKGTMPFNVCQRCHKK